MKISNDLKLAWLNIYSDKWDIYILNIKLTELRKNKYSPFEFFNKPQYRLNLHITYWTTHIIPTERPIIQQFCENIVVRLFFNRMEEPLGSLMRTKTPIVLNDTLNIMTNDFQLKYKQNFTQNVVIMCKGTNHSKIISWDHNSITHKINIQFWHKNIISTKITYLAVIE